MDGGRRMGTLNRALVVATGLLLVAPAAADERQEDAGKKGSLATMAPVGRGRSAMSLGGGVAVTLPFYLIEYGYGLNDRVDLVFHYETVVGVLHYVHVAVRYSPIDIGKWKLGTRLSLDYSFFGIQTEQLNLTSTLYSGFEGGVSGPVSGKTDLFFALGGEFDFVEYDIFDDHPKTRPKYAYDATIVRIGMKTALASELDVYLSSRLRIPVEVFTYDAQNFSVIPFIELGGTWSW